MQWFTIGGTSPPSGLAIVETFRKWWTTALPSMTGTWCFPSFYRWKIKLFYLLLHLPFQILPRNRNCNVLNVFFYLSTGSARVSAEIEKDWVLGMQSDGLGEIEMFYLFLSPSSYLFQSFYCQQGSVYSTLSFTWEFGKPWVPRLIPVPGENRWIE